MKSLFVTLLFVGCSHISVEDARVVSTKAKTIEEVYAILGDPESVTWEGTIETAYYIDQGWHTKPLAFIPLANIALLPIWFSDWLFFNHKREVVVRFNPQTGNVLTVKYDLERGVLVNRH